jgi:hypothetical protein
MSTSKSSKRVRELQDSFSVRASRRSYQNRGKVCTSCGQSDPLLILEDGLCANCTVGHHHEEEHHLLGWHFRARRQDKELVVPVSPNAHRLLSDLQADHRAPSFDDSGSRDFLESQCLELLAALAELWAVLEYLHEKPDLVQSIPVLVLIQLVGLILMNLDRLNLSKVLARTKEIYYAKQF